MRELSEESHNCLLLVINFMQNPNRRIFTTVCLLKEKDTWSFLSTYRVQDIEDGIQFTLVIILIHF